MTYPPRSSGTRILTNRGGSSAVSAITQPPPSGRSPPPDEALLEERRGGHAIRDDLLDLMEQGLALLAVQLLRLALEQIVDFGQRAVRVGAALGEKRLEPRGGVARRACRADEESRQLLLSPRGEKGGALHHPHRGADPDGLEIAADRLPQRRVGRQRRESTCVEAVRI